MPRGNWILFVLSALLATLIIFKPQIGQEIRNSLSPSLVENERELFEKENTELRAEIAAFRSVRDQLRAGGPIGGVNAVVYSRYPFNFRNEIIISAGADDGVTKGSAVVFGKFLIGEIKEVSASQSVVRTVFDGDFHASVRVGATGYDALFEGGLEPALRLIPKNAVIKDSDSIYSASPNFPYGLAIGEISGATVSNDQFFQEAGIKIPYDINLVKIVSVVK